MYARAQLFAVAACASLIGRAPAQPPPVPEVESRIPVAGLTYGKSDALPLPKTILFSASPAEIVEDAEEWSRRGVSAFFVDYVAREWSSDIWGADGKPWTIGESDDLFAATKQAVEVCRRVGSETFLKIAFDNPFEWFNETAWQRIENNFRQFAIFARDTGCTGIALDIEYIDRQYAFDWEGYTYAGYTRNDLVEKIRERMTAVSSVLYDEFPDMVFLTFPEQGFGLGSVIHAAWIEEAARREAPGGIHYCLEWTYRSPNIRYMFAHAWACNALFHDLLSPRAAQYWREKCSLAAGVWPFGFNYETSHDPGMTVEECKQAYAASLMMSPRYNWIYSHNSRAQLLGRDLDKVSPGIDIKAHLRIFADREIVLDAPYAELANELRSMRLRDFSTELGLEPAVRFIGPQDRPELTRIPAGSVPANESRWHWDLAKRYIAGEPLDLREVYGTVTRWLLIGPFPNGGDFEGHRAAYPPENEIDLSAEYDGVNGKTRWMEAGASEGHASVDLTRIFSPSENVTAYALCYVTAPREQQVQLRIGTNDAGKLWLGGKLVWDYPHEGNATFDRAIIPVTLPKGKTPILIKVSNRLVRWAFVFRITDSEGRPAQDLSFEIRP